MDISRISLDASKLSPGVVEKFILDYAGKADGFWVVVAMEECREERHNVYCISVPDDCAEAMRDIVINCELNGYPYGTNVMDMYKMIKVTPDQYNFMMKLATFPIFCHCPTKLHIEKLSGEQITKIKSDYRYYLDFSESKIRLVHADNY